MTLPGGPADKIGNRYELKWTADNLVRVLLGEATRLRLEPLVDGAEFWVETDGIREYHQVKRQQTNAAGWTLAALRRERVLASFKKWLATPGALCVFVSTHSVRDLQKLVERAAQAEGSAEFLDAFTSDQDSKDALKLLAAEWGCSDVDVYDALLRIRVKTLDEASVDNTVRRGLRVAVHGDVEAALDRLMMCGLNRVHEILSAEDLWGELAGVGVTRSRRVPASLRKRIDEITAEYLASASFVPILQRSLERKESGELQKHVGRGCSLVLVHGVAGTGKTGVLRQLISREREAGKLVLAVRLDRSEPATTVDGLGAGLGLETSPVTALMQAGDRHQEKLIVLDQGDSMCMAAGRHPELFDAVDALIREASHGSNISVVLACRTYDLETDFRLRSMVDRWHAVEVEIGPLDRGALHQVLASCGIDGRQLPETQQRLLSIPLHLFLLTEIMPAKSDLVVPSFGSGNDLLAAYWKTKPLLIRERHGRVPPWGELFATLCEAMDRRGLLTAPVSVLDSFNPEDLEILCSENVLQRVSDEVSFFHESFFSYAFARTFVQERRDAIEVFAGGDQGLLRRAQLRRVLSLLATADRGEFRRVVRALLHRERVRFHLIAVVLDSLRELVNPAPDDWAILCDWASEHAESLSHVDSVVFGQPAWIDFLSGAGVFDKWLRDEHRVEFAVRCLVGTYAARPDLLVKHLAPCVDGEVLRPDLLGYAFERCTPRGATVATGAFFMSLVERRLLPDRIPTVLGGTSDFWQALRLSRSGDDPLTLRLVAEHLRGQCFEGDAKTALKTSSQDARDVLEACADSAPALFLDSFCPLVLELLEAAALESGGDGQPPWRADSIWRHYSVGPHYEIRSVLLALLVKALSTAQAGDTVASRWLRALLECNFTTAHFLVFAATAKGAETDDAALVDLICRRARSNALDVGYHDARHHLVSTVIGMLAERCASDLFEQLDAAIVDYYPPCERGRWGLATLRGRGTQPGNRGYAQWQLLAALPSSRLSTATRRRKQELDRKFRGERRPAPRPVRAEFVPSPIPRQAVSRMDDEAWLGAMEKYDDVHRARRTGLRGSVHELASELGKAASGDPERFARLGCRLPRDCSPSYPSAILRGVADAGLPVQLLAQLVAATHARPDRGCAGAISWLLHKQPQLTWPPESLSAIAFYAIEGRSPIDESWVTLAGGSDWPDRDLLQEGINCDRGAAADAMAQVLSADVERRSVFEPVLAELAERERCDEVRATAVLCCLPLLSVAPEAACSLFGSLVGPFAQVMSSRPAREFLVRAARWAPEHAAPHVERAIRSPFDEAQRAGAAAACVGWLFTPTLFAELLPPVFEGTDAAREGAADMLAELVCIEQFSDEAYLHLFRLLDDTSVSVRRAARRCLYLVKNDLEKLTRVAEGFFGTRAFTDSPYVLVEQLQNAKTAPVRLAIRVGQDFLTGKIGDAADVRSEGVFEATHVAELVVGAYARARGGEREECLDILDELIRHQAFGVVDAIDRSLE